MSCWSVRDSGTICELFLSALSIYMSAVTKVNKRQCVNITDNCLDDVKMYMYNFELFSVV